MSDQKLVASYVAMSGDDAIADQDTIAEVVDFNKDGQVEIAFDAPQLEGGPRIYLKLSLPDLVANGMRLTGHNTI